MIKAVIFDMDGTMVDTEGLWKEVNSALAGMYGQTFDEGLRRNMTGRKEDDALQLFKDFYHLEVSVSELQTIRKKMLFEKMHLIRPNPGLNEILDLLDELHIKKAVATSTFIDFANKVLETVHVRNRFEIVITGNMINHGKPHPEMFLTTAEKLQVDPLECLVLEDAENGVEAGSNAGMKVIAIPNEQTKEHDFSKANKVIKSMLEVNKALLQII